MVKTPLFGVILLLGAPAAAAVPVDSVDTTLFCGVCGNGGKPPLPNNVLVLSCAESGAMISSVDFASYGTPKSFDNICGKWTTGSCNAANSTSVVEASCLGKSQCRIFPNTTTFGDPCFGTAKKLVVQAHCSSGAGTGTCSSPPGPPPPPPPPIPSSEANVAVRWDVRQKTVSTHASLQVVSHRLLERGSPIHDQSFGLLRDLKPHHARYVPWFTHEKPYAGCEPAAPVGVGTPRCKSSWNCTLADEMMGDFWAAVEGGRTQAIPNFSTQPSWLYDGQNNADLKALGDYYGRLLAWYTKGQVTDQCGVLHTSSPRHQYNISLWEIFNEPIAEHHHTVESYTREFDAIVQGIRRWADPGRRIKFVGMNLANIRPAAQVQQWARYFLNASNHAAECRDALDFIAYHSYPTNGAAYTKDPATMAHLFDYYDAFVAEVNQTAAIARALSPTTGTVLDECGTLSLPIFTDRSRPQSAPLYWVASGAGFVYLYLRTAALQLGEGGAGVAVVGMSQLMDDNTREPGVTMVDWTNGNGTARYWALRLVREAVQPGDEFVATVTSSGTGAAPAGVYAQGVTGAGGAAPRRVVVVNKQYSRAAVTVAGAGAGCYALVVDSASGEGPPTRVACDGKGAVVVAAFASAVIFLP